MLAQLEHYRHPFLTVRGTAAGGPLSQGRGLELEGPGVVLSSLRRRDDWLELRLVCERPEPSSAVVTGEFREAREVDLLGRPRRPLSVEAGALRVDLGAWEICTVQLRR